MKWWNYDFWLKVLFMILITLAAFVFQQPHILWALIVLPLVEV